MKIVDAVTSVELAWYNRRWNLFLKGDAQARKDIDKGLIYDRFGPLYLAQHEGVVDYCCEGSGGGCGGTFTMRDGSVQRVSGAWSSNPGDAFKVSGVDCVSTSFNMVVIGLSIPALRALGARFGFIVNETTDAYRYMITPLPPLEKLTLIDRA
ncbi:hypothetical protein [Pseudomonas sp. EA_15y_Pfl1_P102]|uniref:hypothetical protein n=1 Tax=Pseudomonas sp. EA_15y_Pfl1_P102 TaxID=3088685 RepID=UPI0030D9B1EC